MVPREVVIRRQEVLLPEVLVRRVDMVLQVGRRQVVVTPPQVALVRQVEVLRDLVRRWVVKSRRRSRSF